MLENIPQSLLSLREKYNISRALLAEMLHLKSYTSISDFESGRTIPSLPVFLALSDLFGVSMDWLAGRSNVQYSSETLIPLENKLLKEAKTLANTPKDSVPMGFTRLCVLTTIGNSSIYTDPYTRNRAFSLPERADIVLCMQVMKHASATVTEVDPTISLEDINFSTLQEVLLPKLKERDGKKTTTIRLELWTECRKKLETYGQREFTLSPTELMEIKQQAYIDRTTNTN
ncbi:MAG: helix-turn-helix transcriptional regulator [Selenomonas ruminantium]|nr:helix-turn-helix transcriptional regulator [Selenomonas ruminantium]